MTSSLHFPHILRADAALCLACGLPGLLAPGWLAGFLLPQQVSLFGVPMGTVMLELGILLTAYAGLLLFLGTRHPVARVAVAATALADAGWVLGTAALLLGFGGSFSLWGSVALLVIAADTALIGLWKAQALRRPTRLLA